MAKKERVNLSAKVELKVTASQLATTVDKKKVRSRGPGQIGQVKSQKVIHLGNIPREQLVKRIDAATKVLETGKVPKAAQGGKPATKDATLTKCQEKLKKAQEELVKVKDDLKASHEGYHDLKVMYEELLVKCEGEEPKAEPK